MAGKQIADLMAIGVRPRVLAKSLTLFHPFAAQRALEKWVRANGLNLVSEPAPEFGGMRYQLTLGDTDPLIVVKSDSFGTQHEAAADAALALYYDLLGWDFDLDAAWGTAADLAALPDPALALGPGGSEVTILSPNDGSGRYFATVTHNGRTAHSSKAWHHRHNAIKDAASKIQ